MNRQEITDQIFDTILGNVDMSEFHVRFNSELVIDCEVSSREGKIWMMLDDGTCWEMVIKQSDCVEY